MCCRSSPALLSGIVCSAVMQCGVALGTAGTHNHGLGVEESAQQQQQRCAEGLPVVLACRVSAWLESSPARSSVGLVVVHGDALLQHPEEQGVFLEQLDRLVRGSRRLQVGGRGLGRAAVCCQAAMWGCLWYRCWAEEAGGSVVCSCISMEFL